MAGELSLSLKSLGNNGENKEEMLNLTVIFQNKHHER